MAVTQDDIDALNEAITSGTRMVSIGGQTITYQTTDSLIKARNDAVTELARQNNAASGVTRRRIRYASHAGKGFD